MTVRASIVGAGAGGDDAGPAGFFVFGNAVSEVEQAVGSAASFNDTALVAMHTSGGRAFVASGRVVMPGGSGTIPAGAQSVTVNDPRITPNTLLLLMLLGPLGVVPRPDPLAVVIAAAQRAVADTAFLPRFQAVVFARFGFVPSVQDIQTFLANPAIDATTAKRLADGLVAEGLVPPAAVGAIFVTHILAALGVATIFLSAPALLAAAFKYLCFECPPEV
jgi:hypothetical protein